MRNVVTLLIVYSVGCATTAQSDYSGARAGSVATSSTIKVDASGERAAYLQAALEEVQTILGDPAFGEAIAQLDDQPFGTTAGDDCKTTKASEVLAALKSRLPAYVLSTRWSLLHPCSTAGTNVCGDSSINTRWVDHWKGGTAERGLLVNTVAHEMTHVLPREGESCEHSPHGAYTDNDHEKCNKDGAGCTDAFLVSYGWGDLVECAYRVKNKVNQEATVYQCFLNLVDSATISRVTLIPNFDVPATSACKTIKPWARSLIPIVSRP